MVLTGGCSHTSISTTSEKQKHGPPQQLRWPGLNGQEKSEGPLHIAHHRNKAVPRVKKVLNKTKIIAFPTDNKIVTNQTYFPLKQTRKVRCVKKN